MSRIGKIPLSIPIGTTIKIKNHTIILYGPLGKLRKKVSSRIQIEVKKNTQKIKLKIFTSSKIDHALHGLYRSLIQNMFIGITQGFTKKLEIVGVGYKVLSQGQRLEFILGYSHNIIIEIPPEIIFEIKYEKGKNSIVILKSQNNQLLGMVSAKIRSFRIPDVYQGKGIRYVGEEVRKKMGKSA